MCCKTTSDFPSPWDNWYRAVNSLLIPHQQAAPKKGVPALQWLRKVNLSAGSAVQEGSRVYTRDPDAGLSRSDHISSYKDRFDSLSGQVMHSYGLN